MAIATIKRPDGISFIIDGGEEVKFATQSDVDRAINDRTAILEARIERLEMDLRLASASR